MYPAPMAFRVHWKVRSHPNSMYLNIIWTFFLAVFNFFVCCVFSVLIIMCYGDFLFWPNLFAVLHASCTFIGISSRLGNFSSMISLKIFLCLWTTQQLAKTPIQDFNIQYLQETESIRIKLQPTDPLANWAVRKPLTIFDGTLIP